MFNKKIILLFLAVFFVIGAVKNIYAVPYMIELSSAVFNGAEDNDDRGNTVVLDESGNIIVSGSKKMGAPIYWTTVKYNSDLSDVLASADVTTNTVIAPGNFPGG